MYDLSKIFKIVDKDEERVVLELKDKSPLTYAKYPFIPGKTAYISVSLDPGSRCKTHILTVIKEDSSTFSFQWGYGGHTLISDNLEKLRKEVVNFLYRKGYDIRPN